MSRPLTEDVLREESATYVGSCGDSTTARKNHFIPAFRDEADGRVELARLKNGCVAPMHLITALPKSWATRVDDAGNVLELIETIVAGFVRDGRFYTREEAALAK